MRVGSRRAERRAGTTDPGRLRWARLMLLLMVMQNTNRTDVSTIAAEATPTSGTPRTPWHEQVGDMLTQAAALCADHGVDLEQFMKGAWSAYLEAKPGMRAELEDVQLRAQLDALRKRGEMPEA